MLLFVGLDVQASSLLMAKGPIATVTVSLSPTASNMCNWQVKKLHCLGFST